MASEQYSTLELCREATASRTRIAALEAQLVKANTDTEKFEREWYLRGDRIEDLEAQLAALQWKPIDEKHLPKVDDEVLDLVDHIVRYMHDTDAGFDERYYRGLGYTHFRPINAPRKEAQNGK